MSHPLFPIGLHVLKNSAVSILLAGNHEISHSPLPYLSHIMISTFLFLYFSKSPAALHPLTCSVSVSLTHHLCVQGWVNTGDTHVFFRNTEPDTARLWTFNYYLRGSPSCYILLINQDIKFSDNYSSVIIWQSWYWLLVLRQQNKSFVKDTSTVET